MVPPHGLFVAAARRRRRRLPCGWQGSHLRRLRLRQRALRLRALRLRALWLRLLRRARPQHGGGHRELEHLPRLGALWDGHGDERAARREPRELLAGAHPLGDSAAHRHHAVAVAAARRVGDRSTAAIIKLSRAQKDGCIFAKRSCSPITSRHSVYSQRGGILSYGRLRSVF